MRHLLVMAAVMIASPVGAAEPPVIAVFDFAMINTSPSTLSAAENERLARLDGQLRAGLASRYAVVGAATPAGASSIRGCNGCELDIARRLGAAQIAYGWMQKVSDLILNVNLVIEDAQTGKILRADSVDIRGNTDESWTRGLRYLLNERLFPGD